MKIEILKTLVTEIVVGENNIGAQKMQTIFFAIKLSIFLILIYSISSIAL